MKLFHTLLLLFFAFLAIAAPPKGPKSPKTSPSNHPASTPNYQAAQKHAKDQLQLNHMYAFKKGDRASHTVLVVGTVVHNAAGELDFDATGFDITKQKQGTLNPKTYAGAICSTRTHEEWVCDGAKRYVFLGETQSLTQVEISERAGAINEGDNCYNVATNNCKHFANKLWNDIKARSLFLRDLAELKIAARSLDTRDLVEWILQERDIEKLGMYERDVFDQDIYERDAFDQDIFERDAFEPDIYQRSIDV